MFIYSTYTKESATKILKQTHNFYSSENVSTRELLIVEVFFSYWTGILRKPRNKQPEKNYYKTCKYVIERYWNLKKFVGEINRTNDSCKCTYREYYFSYHARHTYIVTIC